tara:strand:+ start:753 stop:1157 length:405 start_codon:yes stop_codon:yes gene_type:complete
MSKKQNIELMTDEEVLTRGAVKTDEKIAKLNLRPITIRTLSQMKRNGILDNENQDVFQKTAAFGFIHSASKEEVSAVVSDKEKFQSAVDDWMDENFTHHNEMEPLAEAMNKSFEEYSAAASTGSVPYQGNGSKN